jgi:O-antigen/teichoic acid export membrane protein
MTTASDDDEYLAEIVQKSSVGIAAFTAERMLLAAVAYITTTVLGAAAYGFLSVFTRGEIISRNIVAGLGDGYTRIVPRASASARRTVLSVGTVGFITVWAVIAIAIVVLRGPLIDATLLRPRHEGVVVLFAISLLPFLLLRNIRDMFRALRRIRVAMLVSRIFTPLTLLAGVMFAVFIGGQSLFGIWLGVAAAALAATVAGSILLTYGTDLQIGSFRSHRSVVQDFLRYSVDATGVAVLELVQRRAVFVVMALYLSPVAAGAFSLSIIVGLVVRWPLSGINGILPPIAAALYSDGETQTLQQLYQQTSRLATVVTTPVFALAYVYAPDILTVFNDAYAQQSAVLRLVLTGQYAATVFGSVGLLLLMTDNERASLRVQVLNAGVSLPLMIVLTTRFGPHGLGAAYLVSLLLNNTTELVLLYVRDGFVPFSHEQAYTAVLALPLIAGITVTKSVAGSTTTALVVVVVVGSYVWFGRRFLLRSADRNAVRALLE